MRRRRTSVWIVASWGALILVNLWIGWMSGGPAVSDSSSNPVGLTDLPEAVPLEYAVTDR